MLAALGLTAAAVVPATVITASPASAACYGTTYSGYVMQKSGSYYLYLWNSSTGCQNWVWASQAWTCQLYEWYNGYQCPTFGGGGGGSW